MLPPVAGLRVLDAGCGGGRTSAWLIEQGADVVDTSEELLRLARERLPFEDGSFDVVVSSLVMHYLRDWVPTLRELRRGGSSRCRRITRRWMPSSPTRATTSPPSPSATSGRWAGARSPRVASVSTSV